MKDLLLHLNGPDQTGIVARLAEITTSHGGNWLDSRMIRLGGTFSGIVRVALGDDAVDPFSCAAAAFLEQKGYQLSVHPADPAEPPQTGRLVGLELSGQDHPGIVQAIFAVFQRAGVNVEELSTGLRAAPWSGTPVFEARARLRLPQEHSLDALQSELEAIAADLLVEVRFSPDG
jgi:glycine cleavage system regulatory protein